MTKGGGENQDKPLTPAAMRELAALARILATGVASVRYQHLFGEMADKLEAEAEALCDK